VKYKIVPVHERVAYLLSDNHKELFDVYLRQLSYHFMNESELKAVIIGRANDIRRIPNPKNYISFADVINHDITVKPRFKGDYSVSFNKDKSGLDELQALYDAVSKESLEDTIKRAELLVHKEASEYVFCKIFDADFFNYRIRPFLKYQSRNSYSFDDALLKLNSVYPVILAFSKEVHSFNKAESDKIDKKEFAKLFIKSALKNASKLEYEINSETNKILARFKELIDFKLGPGVEPG